MSKKTCKKVDFSECELAILRMAVDKAEKKLGKRMVNSEEVQNMIDVVENFLKLEKVICYGGTAINNILPENDKFYNKELEIPDYDFFSFEAIETAKKLADLYYTKGFTEVEAKAAQHHGTYKVFVNFIPVADITQMDKSIFFALQKQAIRVAGILYAPPNFLRMSMYLELSRPAGDISRWEKVLKRLTLLNKNYPINTTNCGSVKVQRKMVTQNKESEIYEETKNSFIDQGVVFFGGFAISLYSQYMPKKPKVNKIADFEIISHDPRMAADIVVERLQGIGIKNCAILEHAAGDEIVPKHFEVKVGKDTIAFVYEPIACHSYNTIQIHGKPVKIATIDTMLSFYLAFLYVNRPYYTHFLDRILCMCKFLFDVQQKNRFEQKGLLERFSVTCYGHQESKEEIRAEKASKFKELELSPNTEEKEEWFLKYKPTKNVERMTRKNSNLNKYKNKNKNSQNDTNTNSKSKRRRWFISY